MSKHSAASNHTSIDPAVLARIVSTVIARLKEMDATTTKLTIESKVIDAKTIESFAVGTTVLIAKGAVITPAAKDEAKLRRITLHRTTNPPTSCKKPDPINAAIIDSNDARAEAVTAQLNRRGIRAMPANIVLSDTPAKEVADLFGRGHRATMIGSIDDVLRFGRELNPDAWVLDMKRMNLITAVNVVTAIDRFRKTNA